MLSLAKLTTATGGTAADSLVLIKKSVSVNPDGVASRLALIDFYMANDEPKKADSAAQEALAAIPDKPELLDTAGRAQARAGEVNKALATYGKLATLQPSSPLPYLRMAEIQLTNKNTVEAVKNLRKALEIRPNLFEAQRELVRILLGKARPSTRLPSLGRLKDSVPMRPLVTYSKGISTPLKGAGQMPRPPT